jgi:hypothetical protein
MLSQVKQGMQHHISSLINMLFEVVHLIQKVSMQLSLPLWMLSLYIQATDGSPSFSYGAGIVTDKMGFASPPVKHLCPDSQDRSSSLCNPLAAR